ncbi:MAG: phosphatase PAP2 family protein [Nanoarchaeota archaeon]|nr:phosphatase PAP2 family protein [Nanoarchaeota archaeon]MBU1028043.1 phosphatase PAP2 family protein [Nanoarchaeota archaeon]
MLIKKFFEEITFLGGVLFYSIFLLYFLLEQKYIYFGILLTSLILVYFVTFLIRIFYFKTRPEKVKYNNFLEKIDASAFPSIHAARVFILFLFFISFINNFYFFFLFLLFVLFLTIYSRIYLRKHDIVDVFGGLILGTISFFVSFLIW